MTELRYDAWTDPGHTPSLRLVPDLPRVVGDGLLAPEAGLDQEMVVRRRVPVTHDVLTLVLEPTVPGTFAYAPGQFVTLVVDVDGVAVERCYTLSSPPTRPHLLTITVKRIEGGALSPYLHDRLEPGDRVAVRGPHGDFTVAAHPAARYLLLSAGSGVTPTLSTVRTMADLGELDDVVVVHSARTPADLACRGELDALAADHPGLRVVWVCEDDSPGSASWQGPRGRLTADLLRAHVPDVGDREVFTCGPPGYMGATRALLADLDVDPGRCHEESFVLAEPAAPAVPSSPSAVEVPEVLEVPAADPRDGDGDLRALGSRGRLRARHDRARRGPAGRHLPAELLRRRAVRDLQVRPARGQGRDEPPGRDPPARGRRRQVPAVLLHPGRRHRRRRLTTAPPTLPPARRQPVAAPPPPRQPWRPPWTRPPP